VPCREHLAQLRGQQKELDGLGAAVLIVSFEPPAQAVRLARTLGLPYPVLSDPERSAYRAFGLGQGSRERLWSRQTAGAYLRGLKDGHLPRWPRGDVAQLGGDFVINPEGNVTFAYRGTTPADRPPVAELVEAVRRSVARPSTDGSPGASPAGQ
jgi:hypothetical protein